MRDVEIRVGKVYRGSRWGSKELKIDLVDQ